MKDRKFAKGEDRRISLSALGVDKFVLPHGTILEFPSSLQMAFDFGFVIGNGAIREIFGDPDLDRPYLEAGLRKFGIGMA